MKKFILIAVVFTLLVACKTETKQVEDKEIEATEEVTETPEIALANFNEKAGEFVNKEVKVKGIVDHVCKHGGKKLLLVTDEGDAHVFSDERFDEALKGSEIVVTGVVEEERIDEAYLLKMEEDNIKSHSEGQSNEEQFEAKKKHVQQYRDEMKAKNV
ncbi:MAG TPA: hypothetical protein VJ970_00740, partial [Flavobacteriaceae bacterium]|nr:hypothetical protein [Flavobacteriaceae bacterium]